MSGRILNRAISAGVFVGLAGLAGCSTAKVQTDGTAPAAEPSTSNQPYIDSVLRKMDAEGTSAKSSPKSNDLSTPYLDAKRKELEEKDQAEGRLSDSAKASKTPHIDQLKAENPSLAVPPKTGEYLAQQKELLGPPREGGAIEAVKEGRSQLYPLYQGEPRAAIGFRYGLSVSRDISAGSETSAQSFDSLYGGRYVPDLTLFYDHEILRHSSIGSLGLMGSVGIAYFNAAGTFLHSPTKPEGGSFSNVTRTKFQFFQLPLMLGVSARINLLKYIQPYVFVGPALIGYVEMRSDNKAGNRGMSQGIHGTGGVAILMDWISPSARWEAYSTNGIHHTYLTVEFTTLQTLAGDVSFTGNGLTAGITLEY